MATLREMQEQFAELTALVGKTAYLNVGGSLFVPVETLDAKHIRKFNRTDILVKPVMGYGEQWVSKARLVLDEVEAMASAERAKMEAEAQRKEYASHYSK